MGYDSSDRWQSKKDVIAEVACRAVAKKSVRDGCWFLEPGVDRAAGKLFVHFAKIERERGRYYAKVLSECEHPYYFDCPKAFLDKSESVCAGWREQVVAHWAKKEAV